MKQTINLWWTAALGIALSACHVTHKQSDMETYEKGTFGYDLHYLQAKDSLVLLTDETGRTQVIVSPGYQAKVFTSTAGGLSGKSLGYLNYKALEATEINPHMNGYGGENRFWLGPEGGQYSVYFAPGSAQVYDNWHTPKATDTEPWEVVSSSRHTVALRKAMSVTNYKGTRLAIGVDRSVTLLTTAQIADHLGIRLAEDTPCVGYATENKVTNQGNFAWTAETGTICIWILDMFNTAPRSLTIIPFRKGHPEEATEGDETGKGDESGGFDKLGESGEAGGSGELGEPGGFHELGKPGELGKIATTDYFGEIPPDRLYIGEEALYLKTDGRHRSKLGMTARRTKAIAANYGPDEQRLTIATFDVSPRGTYLNQEWNPAKDPLVGDALNAYNDGPLEDGSLMGPFLEIESASPAAFLSPGESLTHRHQVFHFLGDVATLGPISEALLGIPIGQLQNIFPTRKE